MQTGLGRFGIGKLGPHNRPVSQALPSLPTFVPGNTVAKRVARRLDSESEAESSSDSESDVPQAMDISESDTES